jgi:hypothetical protein
MTSSVIESVTLVLVAECVKQLHYRVPPLQHNYNYKPNLKNNKLMRTLPKKKKKKNSVAFSPQANYTDGATAICRRKLVPTFCG